MLYLTCTTITSVDLAHYGVSRVKNWVSRHCGTRYGSYTVDSRYNDSICYKRFCCLIKFAVIKKLDVDPSKA